MYTNRHSRKMDEVIQAYRDFSWSNQDAYAQYLAQTYYFVDHSTKLLAFSAGLVENQKIFNRFIDHIKEESGHEVIALRDLKHLGYSIDDFPELAITEAFYETQYYKIMHKSPYALLGYILMLEILGVEGCKFAYEKVTETLPMKTAMFLKVHSEDDIEHVEEAKNAINHLSPATQEVVMDNFMTSADLYISLLSEVQKTAELRPDYSNASEASNSPELVETI